MAFTYSDFKKALRALWGEHQTRLSGDGGGDVKDHAARLSQRYVTGPNIASAAASGTSSIAGNIPVFTAAEECDVKAIYVTQTSAATLTATDYINLNVIKRKATSFSLTEQVATFKLNQTDSLSPNVLGASHAMTIATTASVIDMDAGDTLFLDAKLNGTNLTGIPGFQVTVVVEEK